MAGRNPGMIKGAAGKGMVPHHAKGYHPRMDVCGRITVPGKGQHSVRMPAPEDDRNFQKVCWKRGPARAPAPNLVPPSCEACGNFAARLHCSNCKTALFCDEICQRRIWPTHKLVCEPPDEILRKITDNPDALLRNEGKVNQEIKEIADALSSFFARGGRKKQARLRGESVSSVGSSGQSSCSSSRTCSRDSRSSSTARLRAVDSNSTGNVGDGQDNPDARLNDEEVDAKRPDWVRQRLRESRSADDQTQQATSPIASNNSHISSEKIVPPMRPRLNPIGGGFATLRNDVQMPRIVLGTGGEVGLSGREGREAICAALKLGYRALDTSEMNRNLTDVAWACLKVGIPRKELFIIAKIAPWNYSYARTRNAFFRQLAELRTDYVDLLLLQWPHSWAPLQTEWKIDQWKQSGNWKEDQTKGSWRAMEKLYEEGKVRAIGISNFTIDQCSTLLSYCRERPHVMQCESHPHWPNQYVRSFCRQKEIAFQGYAPFGGEDNGSGARDVDCEVVAHIAELNQTSPARVCLYWNLARNASVVVKSKTFERLRENLQAVDDLVLKGVHLQMLDAVADRYKELGPVYWGHNDQDGCNPWYNEEALLDEAQGANFDRVSELPMKKAC